MSNKNLHKAKVAKNDEFYTQYVDIEQEVFAYLGENVNPFKDKVILCPCDDPAQSNFTLFFALNFEKLGLRKLISTSYAKEEGGKGRKYELTGDTNGDGVVDSNDIVWTELEGNGDFASEEVTRLRDEADIIVTNPPFSLFRKFLAWIMEGQKQFLILGSMNAITYKEVFPLIKSNQIWLGVLSGSKEYIQPDGTMKKMGNTCWFTNIDHTWRHKRLDYVPMAILTATGVTFNKYDNYDAIDVPKCVLIPAGYDGVMGVPVSFLTQYNPDQFEVVGVANNARWLGDFECLTFIDGDPVYNRLLIKWR